MAKRKLVRNDQRIARKLRQIPKEIKKEVSHKEILELLVERTRERFEPRGKNTRAQKAPNGTPWTPISPLTVKRRKVNKNAAQALVDTGAMRDAIVILRHERSFSGFGTRTGAEGIIGVLQGPQRKKAIAHQLGTHRIPARPFLGISEGDVRAVFKLIRNAAKRIEKL